MLEFAKKMLRRFRYRRNSMESILSGYRARGVVIGEDVHLINCTIDEGHGFLVEIGNRVTVTGTTILAHDASTKLALGYSKVGKVRIGDEVFIGTGCIILPNVTIGSKVIIGAGTVVSKDVPSNSVLAGNPMRVICSYESYVKKHELALQSSPRYETFWPDKTAADIEEMKRELDGVIGYDP